MPQNLPQQKMATDLIERVILFRHLYCRQLLTVILVFGHYNRDLSYTDSEINIHLEHEHDLPKYVRDCCGNRTEKYLATPFDGFHIHPVEPVNLPTAITRYLEISFPLIVLPPSGETTIYVKFPVEAGVFFEVNGKLNLLDIFSLVPAKFSLYGLPSSGIITRWYASEVYRTVPSTDPRREGTLELTIKNSSTQSAEISRAIFDSNSMCLFYGERVSMTATMEIMSPVIASTQFVPAGPKDCPYRSTDLYEGSAFSVSNRKIFFMESGTS